MTVDWERSDRNAGLRRVAKPALLVVVGLVSALLAFPSGGPQAVPVVVETPGPDTDPSPQPPPPREGSGEWSVIDGGPLSPRARPVAVWSGEEVLVWSGIAFASNALLDDGAAYDPARERWRPLATPPVPGRVEAAATWTGRELFVWGGRGTTTADLLGDGAAYDPRRDRWRRLPPSPLAPRRRAQAVWTGEAVLVWGGDDGDGAHHADGALYDPVTNRWTVLPRGPLTRRQDRTTSVVGLAGGAFIWSASPDDAVAVRYDVRDRSWHRLWTPRLDPGRTALFTAAAGGVLGWGTATIGDRGPLALKYTTEPDWWATVARPPTAPSTGDSLLGGEAMAVSWGRAQQSGIGIAFDALSDEWRPITAPPQPLAFGSPLRVWTGDRLFVWYAIAPPDARNRAVMWQPGNPWRPLDTQAVRPGTGMSALWTGWLHDQQQMLLWGGLRGEPTNAGGAYDPGLGLWETMPDAPIAARFGHAAVWTGTEMLVVGGHTGRGQPLRRDGAAYDPVARRWRVIADAPTALAAGQAAVAGQLLYGAGGQPGRRVAVARYDPDQDRWERLPPAPLQAGDEVHVVWSGFEVWVWTVDEDGARGAAWHPRRRSWRTLPPLAAAAAPWSVVWSERRMFTVDASGATWSLGRGTEGWREHPAVPVSSPALVWSGRNIIAHDPQPGPSGGTWLLDPRADAWVAGPEPDLPSASSASLLWSGRHLFAFAGGAAAVLPP